MACAACGATAGRFFGGDWIGATERSETLSGHDIRLGRRVTLTKKTYSDITAFHLDLCDECFFKQATKAGTRSAAFTLGFVAIFSAIGLFAMASPNAGLRLRLFGAAFLALTWLALVGFLVRERRRWSRKVYSDKDRPFLDDYARKHNKMAGRNVFFAPREWKKYLKETEAQWTEDSKYVNFIDVPPS
jgi:hypothetical protein